MEHPAEKLLLLVATAVAMAGMGATVTRASLTALVRHPRGVLVGIACQYGLMPLLAVALAGAFRLPAPMALGLILVGCSPGGLASNIFTYFARANVALSITMTATSSALAWLMMPALLLIYATPYTSAALQIPYRELLVGLLVILVPAGMGVAVRSRSEYTARRLERAGGVAGIVVLTYLAATWFPKHGHMLANAGGWIWAGSLLSLAGFLAGYAGAWALGLSVPDRRAVSLETGLQNATLTMTIIAVAFDGEMQAQIIRMPLIYGLSVLVVGGGAVLLFRLRARA